MCMERNLGYKYHSTILVVLCDLSTQTGWTPLMMASFKGHDDIVRILIEAKAQVNTQEEVHVHGCICTIYCFKIYHHAENAPHNM